MCGALATKCVVSESLTNKILIIFPPALNYSQLILPYCRKVWQGKVCGEFGQSSVIVQTKPIQFIYYLLAESIHSANCSSPNADKSQFTLPTIQGSQKLFDFGQANICGKGSCKVTCYK